MHNIPQESSILSSADFKKKTKTDGIKEYAHEEKIETLDALKDLIDEQDPSGKKYGLTTGTVFQYEDGSEILSARIKKIQKDGIIVEGAIHDHPMPFQMFYEAFVAQKGKRNASMSNLEDFFGAVKNSSEKSVADGFKNIVLKDGHLYPDNEKLKGKKSAEITHLIGKDDKCIKIEKMSDDKIVFIEGKLDEKTKGKAKLDDAKKYSLRPDQFLLHLENAKYQPKL